MKLGTTAYDLPHAYLHVALRVAATDMGGHYLHEGEVLAGQELFERPEVKDAPAQA